MAIEGVPQQRTLEESAQFKITNMAEAMSLAMDIARETVDDPDPDPYGYVQELEHDASIDLLTTGWKAKPDDARWVKRVKARARKAVVGKLFLQGFTVHEIAARVKAAEPTVYKDIHAMSNEWRKSYIADIEILAGQDLERLTYYLSKLADNIEKGDVKSIVAAIEIIKERGSILGYRQGVQLDIETYVREVAEANGFDPDRAVAIAHRVVLTMK